MRTHHHPLASSLSALGILGASAALVGVGVASVPGAEGRALPPLVKASLWKYACDLPSADWNVDCTTNTDPTKCTWTRSGGESYEPVDDTQMARAVQSGFFWTMLSPTNDAFKLGTYPEDSDEDMPTFLFRLVSGLDLSLPPVDGSPYRLNPAAIAWGERELLPLPSEPMCGHTAQEIYDRAFKHSTRTFALALAHLAKTGNLAKVDLARLDKERGSRRGGYWNTCRAFSGANKKTYSEGALADSCFFWLRRGASSSLPELASSRPTSSRSTIRTSMPPTRSLLPGRPPQRRRPLRQSPRSEVRVRTRPASEGLRSRISLLEQHRAIPGARDEERP